MSENQPDREPLGGSLIPTPPESTTPPAAPGYLRPPPPPAPPSYPGYQALGLPPLGPSEAFPVAPVKPHRATLLTIMAVAGFLCCAPLGIVAFVMGSLDLKEMDAGRMDSSGRSATNTARYLGLIFFALDLALFFAAAVSGGFSR